MKNKSIAIASMVVLIAAPLLAGSSPGLDRLAQAVSKGPTVLEQPTQGEMNQEIAQHEQGNKDAQATLRGANAAGKMVYIKQLKEAARRYLAYHQAAIVAMKGQ